MVVLLMVMMLLEIASMVACSEFSTRKTDSFPTSQRSKKETDQNVSLLSFQDLKIGLYLKFFMYYHSTSRHLITSKYPILFVLRLLVVFCC